MTEDQKILMRAIEIGAAFFGIKEVPVSRFQAKSDVLYLSALIGLPAAETEKFLEMCGQRPWLTTSRR